MRKRFLQYSYISRSPGVVTNDIPVLSPSCLGSPTPCVVLESPSRTLSLAPALPFYLLTIRHSHFLTFFSDSLSLPLHLQSFSHVNRFFLIARKGIETLTECWFELSVSWLNNHHHHVLSNLTRGSSLINNLLFFFVCLFIYLFIYFIFFFHTHTLYFIFTRDR